MAVDDVVSVKLIEALERVLVNPPNTGTVLTALGWNLARLDGSAHSKYIE